MKGSPVYLPEASQRSSVSGLVRVVRAFSAAAAKEMDTPNAASPAESVARLSYYIDRTKVVPRRRGIDAALRVMRQNNPDDE